MDTTKKTPTRAPGSRTPGSPSRLSSSTRSRAGPRSGTGTETSGNHKTGTLTSATGTGIIRTPALLASSLDALVRSTRAKGPSLESIAKRITSLWRQHAGAKMVFEPTAVRIEEELALEATGQEGAWILPTFMSGLRQLTALPTMRTDDVLRLSEELAGLEPTLEALSAFRDWLWADGAEGFEVDLQPSFVEVIESVSMAENTRKGFASIRGIGLQALGAEQITMSAGELDVAAARPEFQVPLELYHEARESGRLEISKVERAKLQKACDDGAAWIDAETFVVLNHPRLAAAVPPERLARRIIGLTTNGVEPRLLQQLSGIHRREDEYAASLISALESQELDRALARGLQLTEDENIPAVRDFLSVASPKLASGVLQSMIRQAEGENPVFTGLVDLFATGRFDLLVDAVDVPRLQPGEQATLTRAILQTEAARRQLPKILGTLPERTAATMLAEMPTDYLRRMQPLIERLLLSDEPRARETMAHTLLANPSPGNHELLRKILLQTRGKGWPVHTLKPLIRSLIEAGRDPDFAIELGRSIRTSKEVRQIALEALETHPGGLRKALRWRPSELLDPPEVRACLERLRQRSKARR